MRIVVIGANGSTGQEIVSKALTAGHDVVGAVRRPETLAHIKGIELAKIDLSRPETLAKAMEGAEVVVSALGHGGLADSMRFTTLYSSATRSVINAMRQTGVKRLFVLSSGGVVDNPNAPGFYREIIRRLLINNYIDMARMEAIIEETADLEWTIVRLTYLRKGPSKEFLVEEGMLSRGNFQIHYTDAARFIVGELTARDWVRARPVLGYDKGAKPRNA